MIGDIVVKDVTAEIADSQTQTRNNQEHVRVYDPTNERLLKEILAEMKLMNKHLGLITGEELQDDH